MGAWGCKLYIDVGCDDLVLQGFMDGEVGEIFDGFDLIVRLHGFCGYVVASCDFEEYVIERAGWNLTIESPLPTA